MDDETPGAQKQARQTAAKRTSRAKPKAQAPQPDPVQDEAVEVTGAPDTGENWAQYMAKPVVMQGITPPTVHELWCRVMDSVKSVEKGDYNKDQHFRFRGVDATVDAVGPALRRHGVHIRPRKVKLISTTEYTSKSGGRMVNRIVRVTWKVTGPQGDSFTGQSMGEAADSSDKSLAKAQSVAYRVYLLQALSIPTGDPDPDSETAERATPSERDRAVQQAQSSGSYRSREEWEAAQRAAQSKAGEENQDSFPASSNVDPWTGDKPKDAQQDARAAEARKELWRVAKGLGWQWDKLANRFKSDFGMETSGADEATLVAFREQIVSEDAETQAAKTLVQNELGGREVNPDGGTHF